MVNYNEYVYPQILHYGNEQVKLQNSEFAEYFKFTINSGDDSSFILPLTCGGDYCRLDMKEYDLLVDWGDGVEEVVSGTSTFEGHGVSHTYPSVNTNYQITISPNGDLDGWGGAFGFSDEDTDCDAPSNKNKMISLDSPLTKSMVMKETTTDYILAYMFLNCPNLTMGPKFNLPQDISGDIGLTFASCMFYGCTSLTMNDIFQLPQGITSADTYFIESLFNGCSNLVMNDIFQLPQNIIPSGQRFCTYAFSHCSSITTGVQRFFGNVVLNQEQLNENYTFRNAFLNCSSITEECSADTIPQLAISPSSNNYCFNGASDIARANCPVNWGGLLS